MKFKINRGTQEIGGSCVEVWTEKTRIRYSLRFCVTINLKLKISQNAFQMIVPGLKHLVPHPAQALFFYQVLCNTRAGLKGS